MKFILDITITAPDKLVDYKDSILLTGSCFTEHIGNSLAELKFNVLQNPNGILYDPFSIAESLTSYIVKREYKTEDLHFQNDLWHSWHHHSRFSGTDQSEVISRINDSQAVAHHFLKSADWLIITLGTAYSYRLLSSGLPVANCHRAPSGLFRKHLMTIEEIKSVLDNSLYQLFQFNKKLNVIFTVSPVRHIKDGISENNLSKARLLEAVHHLTSKFGRLFYFPAYELVIDVLRDYRFYNEDLVHPNSQATKFVFERFIKSYFNKETLQLGGELEIIRSAMNHRAFNPETPSHQKFLLEQYQKVDALAKRFPSVNFSKELEYFSGDQGR